jgi:hypothetical protein
MDSTMLTEIFNTYLFQYLQPDNGLYSDMLDLLSFWLLSKNLTLEQLLAFNITDPLVGGLFQCFAGWLTQIDSALAAKPAKSVSLLPASFFHASPKPVDNSKRVVESQASSCCIQ